MTREPELMLPAGRSNNFIPGVVVVVLVVVGRFEAVVVVVLKVDVLRLLVVFVLMPKSMYSKYSKLTSGVALFCWPSM